MTLVFVACQAGPKGHVLGPLLNSLRRINSEGYDTAVDERQFDELLESVEELDDWPELSEVVQAVAGKLTNIESNLKVKLVSLAELGTNSDSKYTCVVV